MGEPLPRRIVASGYCRANDPAIQCLAVCLDHRVLLRRVTCAPAVAAGPGRHAQQPLRAVCRHQCQPTTIARDRPPFAVTNAEWVRLNPALLAISAERIKQPIWRQLGISSMTPWRDQDTSPRCIRRRPRKTEDAAIVFLSLCQCVDLSGRIAGRDARTV